MHLGPELAWRMIVFVVLVLGTIVSLVRDVRTGRRLRRHGERATGTITGRRERRTVSQTRAFRAVVRFTTRDGRQVEAAMPNETTHPMRIGTRVPIRYDPDDPGEARIDRLWHRGPFASVVFIAALLVFLALWAWTWSGGMW